MSGRAPARGWASPSRPLRRTGTSIARGGRLSTCAFWLGTSGSRLTAARPLAWTAGRNLPLLSLRAFPSSPARRRSPPPLLRFGLEWPRRGATCLGQFLGSLLREQIDGIIQSQCRDFYIRRHCGIDVPVFDVGAVAPLHQHHGLVVDRV